MSAEPLVLAPDLAGIRPGEVTARFQRDEECQDYLLRHVSRTFALTIPELPPALGRVVSNAYLLCRIIDTVEDEAGLGLDHKAALFGAMNAVLAGQLPAHRLRERLAPEHFPGATPAERELLHCLPRVVAITHRLSANQQQALRRCVAVMGQGMLEFQQQGLDGLRDMAELERYCYFVAGVVGEMLTELFCHHSPGIHRHREQLLALAVPFGQGLQLTNILKDIWEDRQRGACWLPRNLFRGVGLDLDELHPGHHRTKFSLALEPLIALTHTRLRQALDYTLLIPPREAGIRRFCLGAVGLAILTLRNLNARRDFTSSQEIKVSRRVVKATFLGSRLGARQDWLVRGVFELCQAGVPRL